MRTEKRVSLREIARLCNVSATTVSRIANGTGSFTEETRRLVLDTMAREGYKLKDSVAEVYKPIIGCLVSDYTNEVFTDRLAVIERYFREKDVTLLTCETHRDPDLEAELARQLHRMGAVGIIAATASVGLCDNPPPIPIIYMDLLSDQIINDENAYLVSSDDYVGGQLAAQELYHKGCRKPLILNIRYVPHSVNRRIQGFLHNFEEHGVHIDEERILPPDLNKSSFDSAKDLIAYHRAKGTDFDSVFACSDWRAYGALVALRNMGARVPEDVKIIGYDGIRVSRYCDMPITTIQQNTESLCLAVCEMMWSLINHQEVAQRQVLVPIRLQEGKTT